MAFFAVHTFGLDTSHYLLGLNGVSPCGALRGRALRLSIEVVATSLVILYKIAC